MGGLNQPDPASKGLMQPDPAPKGLSQEYLLSIQLIRLDQTKPKGGLIEPLTDPPEGLSQPLGDLRKLQESLNSPSGGDVLEVNCHVEEKEDR